MGYPSSCKLFLGAMFCFGDRVAGTEMGGKDEWYLNRQDSLDNYALCFGRPHSDIAPADCKQSGKSWIHDAEIFPWAQGHTYINYLFPVSSTLISALVLLVVPKVREDGDTQGNYPQTCLIPQVSREENRENTKEKRAVMNASPTHWKPLLLLHLVLAECHLLLQWREVVTLKT